MWEEIERLRRIRSRLEQALSMGVALEGTFQKALSDEVNLLEDLATRAEGEIQKAQQVPGGQQPPEE
jgi:hypothetical protein